MSRKSTLGDALAAHPSVDMLAPAIPIIIWAISGRPVPDDNVSQNLFVALSTLSGLVMAAVTFICSMSYQSESRYMQIARDRYHDELSRNWVSIIAWTAITAVLPLASLCLWPSRPGLSTAISIYALVMMIAKLGRSIHWMKYTLFMQKASMTIGEPFTDKDMQKPSNGTKPTASDNLHPANRIAPALADERPGAFAYSSGCLRGLPPPTPRPGRAAFHRSMVSGSQPRVAPISASGSGRL